MNTELIIIIIIILIGVGLLAFAIFILALLFRGAASILYVYAAFVLEVPWIITVPAFIIFPPLFIGFLIGLVFIYMGEIDEDGSWKTNAKMEEIRNKDQ